MVRNSKTDQTVALRMAHVQARRSEPVSFALTGNRGLRDPQVTRGFRLSAVALERLPQVLSLDLPARLPHTARLFRERWRPGGDRSRAWPTCAAGSRRAAARPSPRLPARTACPEAVP